MIDLTGSMGEELDDVKTKILAMVESVRSKYNKATIRIGMVGYRDKKDSVRFDIWEFDTNVRDFKNWVQTVEASK